MSTLKISITKGSSSVKLSSSTFLSAVLIRFSQETFFFYPLSPLVFSDRRGRCSLKGWFSSLLTLTMFTKWDSHLHKNHLSAVEWGEITFYCGASRRANLSGLSLLIHHSEERANVWVKRRKKLAERKKFLEPFFLLQPFTIIKQIHNRRKLDVLRRRKLDVEKEETSRKFHFYCRYPKIDSVHP
jgi:hypothetical protein